jgi:hypothetical protein
LLIRNALLQRIPSSLSLSFFHPTILSSPSFKFLILKNSWYYTRNCFWV